MKWKTTGLLILSLTLSISALSDTLELKNGTLVNGKYSGGTQYDIRFVVNGQEQLYPIADIAAISFGTTAPSATDTPSSAQPVTSPTSAATSQSVSSESAIKSGTPSTQPTSVPGALNADPASPTAPGSSSATASTASTAPTQTSSAPSSEPTLKRRPAAERSAPRPVAGQMVEIPAGTNLVVRMIDGLDSSQNQIGDRFRASLAQDLIVDGTVVAPTGTNLFGRLTEDKAAGKFSGKSQLKIELTDIEVNNQSFPITTSDYSVLGKSRTTNTAEKVGGGAALGAIIGAIAGGGKGAAIGAGVGGAAGAGVQAIGKGEKVVLPAETMLSVSLQQAVKLPVASTSSN
jgi:hypothetical protein